MHACLRIYDILEHICDDLLANSSQPALAALARTCTTFTDPALNALWHTIPTLEPLIRCLPEDAWKVKGTQYPMLTLTRKTTQADWERCKFYTHRIRQFGYAELDIASSGKLKGSLPTDRTIFMALKPLHSDVPVLTLPKLRSCHLMQNGPAPIPHFAPFLTHTLRSLELTSPAYDPEEILPGILRSVARMSPFVRSLRIDGVSVVPTLENALIGEDGGKGIGPTLMKMLKGLDQLESLVCPRICFPNDAVRYLATGLRIRTLHIKNTVEDLFAALSAVQEPWFRHLQKLSVECSGDLEECAHFLGHVNVSEISYLEVGRNNGVPTEHELCAFINTFSSLFKTKTTLTTLFIHQDLLTGFVSPSHRPTPALKYTMMLHTFAPLLSFPNLTTLNLVFDTRFAFDNADAERMARAWRNLKVLQFGFPGAGWGSGERGKRMTLDGLGAFAKWCPDLQMLGVCVNGVTGTKPVEGLAGRDPRYGGSVQCPSLRFLDVGDSVYEDPVCVARYLVDVFPELQGVYGPDVVVSAEWQKKWMEVSRMVAELSLQRRI